MDLPRFRKRIISTVIPFLLTKLGFANVSPQHAQPTHPNHPNMEERTLPKTKTTAIQPKPKNQPKPQPKHGMGNIQQHPSIDKKNKFLSS